MLTMRTCWLHNSRPIAAFKMHLSIIFHPFFLMNNLNSNKLLNSTSLPLARYAQKRVRKGLFLPSGTYDRYIEMLKTKTVQGNTDKHHVVPKHDNGSDNASNIISISVRDHILAHLLLYLEKGRFEDLLAYTLRKATQNVDLHSHGKRMAYLNRSLGRGRFDPEMQRELG